jgi:hypothetical protein
MGRKKAFSSFLLSFPFFPGFRDNPVRKKEKSSYKHDKIGAMSDPLSLAV